MAAPAPAPRRDVLAGGTGAAPDAASRAERDLVVRGKRAEPVRRASSALESVIGPDGRTRILETELTPWRMICSLELSSPVGGGFGTGWLVGPRTIVTAGHCVFDQVSLGGWASRIEVTPGCNGTEAPFGRTTATRFSSVDRWIETQDPNYDIGCVHLDEPLGERLGYFATAVLPDGELASQQVNISGYPGDKGIGAEFARQQWFHANRVLRVDPRRLFYDVDTYAGQSGAPVWIYEDGRGDQPLVVGIHAYGTGGTPEEHRITANSAPRILPEVLDQIRAWVEADGGPGA